jgi:putative ABC transport system permease protein
MFKNYFKIAFRNMLKYKSYSFINITGLAVSLACALLILLWIQDEKSFDSFHKDVDRIYRIVFETKAPNATHKSATTTGALAIALRNDFPQVEKVARVLPQPRKIVQSTHDKRFTENNFFIVDEDFFEIFTLPLISGSAEKPFAHDQSVVISQRMALKYLGNEDPVGKLLQIGGSPVTVSGVFKDTPHNSHLQFDFLAPMKPVEQHRFFTDWSIQISIFTFVKLKKEVDPKQFEESIRHISQTYIGESLAQDHFEETFFLQPMKDIYLHSNLESEAPISGNALYMYVFYITAVIIILIAGINFINLTTGRISKRGKEIVMRKIVGADKSQIAGQFFFEITVMVLIALALAVTFSEMLLPAFNHLTGKALAHSFWWDTQFMIQAIGLILLMNMLCAVYPIVLYSSFSPLQILKKAGYRVSHSSSVRKGLVILQFALSIGLIIGTLTIFRQLEFVKNKDVGFNKEQILVIPIKAARTARLEDYEQLKFQFTQPQGISQACFSRAIPGDGGLLSFDAWLAGGFSNKKQPVRFCMIDADFMKTYNVQLMAGRAFQNTLADVNNSVIINESASKALGFAKYEDALGTLFNPGYETQNPLTIVGVCRDIHFESLHLAVEPLYLAMSPEWFIKNNQRPFLRMSLRLQTNDLSATLGSLKKKYQELFPDQEFEYFFLDEKLNQQYLQDERFGSIFNIFTTFAIFIACLGLLGLAIFNTEQRVKEIGIRKVAGASVMRILILMTKDFTKWVLLANIIAWPVAWYAANKWLENFAYRIDLTIWPFLLSGLLALLIALLTVSWQAIRTATANPVEALRYE